MTPKPETPGKPDKEEKPDKPSQPEKPEKPSKPEKPEKPEKPTDPIDPPPPPPPPIDPPPVEPPTDVPKLPGIVDVLRYVTKRSYRRMLEHWGRKFSAEFIYQRDVHKLVRVTPAGKIEVPRGTYIVKSADGNFRTLSPAEFQAEYPEI